MIWVFHNNDPLADDLGGGAEHFCGIHRALAASGLAFRLVGARLQDERVDPTIEYLSRGSAFARWWLGLWRWTWANRRRFGPRDVFHFHRNYAAWPRLLLAPGAGRVLVTYHNVSGRVLEGRLGRLAPPLRRLMLLLERRVARRADAILCVSERDRRQLAELVAREPFERARVVPAAFDQALFEASAARPPSPALATRLLLLGRLSHQKNVPLALAVLETLLEDGDDWTLTIAGDGEESARLDEGIGRSVARARLRRLGRVPHARVPALLAEHGILLLTSRYEASPTVVKEALAARRPVVTTDVGDARTWLEEGRNGFVRAATPEDLAAGVRAAARLIREGRCDFDGVRGRLDEAAIMAPLLELYRRLASG